MQLLPLLLENKDVPISAEQDRSSIPFFQKIEMFPYLQSRIEVPFHSSRKWSCSHICRVEQKFHSILLENRDVPYISEQNRNSIPFFQKMELFSYLQTRIEILFHSSRKWRCSHTCKEGQKSQPIVLENETVSIFAEQDLSSSYSSRK